MDYLLIGTHVRDEDTFYNDIYPDKEMPQQLFCVSLLDNTFEIDLLGCLVLVE